jgi:hypothetical protein
MRGNLAKGSPVETATEASMRWLGWNAIAVLAGLALGCAEDKALYTSSKHVPGYTPSGDTPTKALAYIKDQERKTKADSREL